MALNGNEIVEVVGVSGNGQPSGTSERTNTRAIANLSVSTPYLGNVATRTWIPNQLASGSYNPFMARRTHIARDNLTAVSIVYTNWYNREISSGFNSVITASVEYPAGTFTQLTFNGAVQGSVLSGNTLISDMVTLKVNIPNGATFWTRLYINNSVNSIIFSNQVNTFIGDGLAFNSPDLTMGGTVTQATTATVGPQAVLAMTSKASVAIIGDSRMQGQALSLGDTNGDLGEGAPSISQSLPCLDLAVGGDTASAFVSAHTKTLALAAYASHIVCNYGINDLTGGATAATILANLITIRNYFTQPFYQTTIPPVTTSTDNWATTTNQTPVASNSARITLNTSIRNGSFTGMTRYFEIANVVESAQNSGLWTPFYTVDGTHESQLGVLAILASNAIPNYVFSR